jgi:hypothetical protein
MDEKPKLLEITMINPPRWGLLHIPFGVVYGCWRAYDDWKTPDGGISDVISRLVVFVVIIAFWGGAAAIAGAIQAMILNLIMYLMRRGPVITVREVASPAVNERVHRRTSPILPKDPVTPAPKPSTTGAFVIKTWSNSSPDVLSSVGKSE